MDFQTINQTIYDLVVVLVTVSLFFYSPAVVRLVLEILLFSIVVGAFIVFLFFPIPNKYRTSEGSKRTKRYHTSGAILGTINEVFHPSAANASVIQEEKRESRKANPSPEDGLL